MRLSVGYAFQHCQSDWRREIINLRRLYTINCLSQNLIWHNLRFLASGHAESVAISNSRRPKRIGGIAGKRTTSNEEI